MMGIRSLRSSPSDRFQENKSPTRSPRADGTSVACRRHWRGVESPCLSSKGSDAVSRLEADYQKWQRNVAFGETLTLQKSGVVNTVVRGPAPLWDVEDSTGVVVMGWSLVLSFLQLFHMFGM